MIIAGRMTDEAGCIILKILKLRYVSVVVCYVCMLFALQDTFFVVKLGEKRIGTRICCESESAVAALLVRR